MATVRKLPNGKFRADIRKNYNFIQAKTFSSYEEALSWANQADAKISEILSIPKSVVSSLTPEQVEALGGRELLSKLGIEINFLTFTELVDEYNAKWNKKDDNQIPRAVYWQNVFTTAPIKSISSSDIRKALDQYANGKVLKGHGLGISKEINKQRSSNTVLRHKAVLSSIFKFAIKRGYLKENPVESVSIDATANEIERFLDDKERDSLLAACKESKWTKLYLLVMMAITTGMRKSEIVNLRWKDIDLEKGLAKLSTTKNGSRRINPIPAIALEELKKHKDLDYTLVFASTSDPEKPFNFRVQWNKALNRAGVKNFRFHDLRHTAASYLVMNGASLHETAEILGHKSTQTTKRYAHLSTAHKSALADRIMGKVFNG